MKYFITALVSDIDNCDLYERDVTLSALDPEAAIAVAHVIIEEKYSEHVKHVITIRREDQLPVSAIDAALTKYTELLVRMEGEGSTTKEDFNKLLSGACALADILDNRTTAINDRIDWYVDHAKKGVS